MHFLLCLFTLFIACGERKDGHIDSSPSELITQKVKLYCDLSRAQYEEKHYVGTECDSLLYTSLHSLTCDYAGVSQFESQVEPGQWFRSPSHDCLSRGESDSDISKDMITGLAIALEHSKDINAVHRTIDYGKQHNWVMGDGPVSKTLLMPDGIALLNDIVSELSLAPVLKSDSPGFVSNVGFQAHLDVLGLLLRGKLSGLYNYQVGTLKEQATRQPRNALYQAAASMYGDGNMEPVNVLLLNEAFFPADHLPTSDNYCTDYLWERDDSGSVGDWAHCPEEHKVHSGTDFLVAAYVSNGGFNKR